MGKLSGKTAIVTGGARGIGRAYAHKLADLGADVGIIDIDLQSYKQFPGEARTMTSDSIVEELKDKGINVIGINADVTSFEQVREAVLKITSQLGDIDILVANAGGGAGGLEETFASATDIRYIYLNS